MDENSCEDENSERKGEGPDEGKIQKSQTSLGFTLGNKKSIEVALDNKQEESRNEFSNHFDSSIDVSGPSYGFRLPTTNEIFTGEANKTGSSVVLPQLPAPANECPRVRITTPPVEEHDSISDSIGPPPSYSFVMKQKRKGLRSSVSETVIDSPPPPPPPPPTYGGMARGIYMPPETEDANRMCILPSFAEPIWRSHSQPAYCPRCGILVLTITHSHESVTTHIAALALCLFGCWPCCFLPYCMNVCKNTYHHCPICQTYLGSYIPW